MWKNSKANSPVKEILTNKSNTAGFDHRFVVKIDAVDDPIIGAYRQWSAIVPAIPGQIKVTDLMN